MRVFTLIALFLTAPFAMAPAAFADPGLEDLRFLEGHWRGGEGFVFEEIWSAPEGGVMTGMARGVASGELRFLEYILITDEDGALVMRFKHFNADYSNWEGEDEPLTLTLTEIDGADATFTADPPTHTVKSIRYWTSGDDMLQVDVAQIENGEEGGFTLLFKRMD